MLHGSWVAERRRASFALNLPCSAESDLLTLKCRLVSSLSVTQAFQKEMANEVSAPTFMGPSTVKEEPTARTDYKSLYIT